MQFKTMADVIAYREQQARARRLSWEAHSLCCTLCDKLWNPEPERKARLQRALFRARARLARREAWEEAYEELEQRVSLPTGPALDQPRLEETRATFSFAAELERLRAELEECRKPLPASLRDAYAALVATTTAGNGMRAALVEVAELIAPLPVCPCAICDALRAALAACKRGLGE